MAILTRADHEAIRKAILVDLDDEKLPSSTIELDIYTGRAEAELEDRIPTVELITGDANLKIIRRAAVYLCAALLCPAVERLTRVTHQARDVSFSRSGFDAQERATELRGLADEEIRRYATPDAATPARPTQFATATGRRGR